MPSPSLCPKIRAMEHDGQGKKSNRRPSKEPELVLPNPKPKLLDQGREVFSTRPKRDEKPARLSVERLAALLRRCYYGAAPVMLRG